MTGKNSKILVLGVDGLDPGLTNRFRAEGIMPHFDELLQRGSALAQPRLPMASPVFGASPKMIWPPLSTI